MADESILQRLQRHEEALLHASASAKYLSDTLTKRVDRLERLLGVDEEPTPGPGSLIATAKDERWPNT